MNGDLSTVAASELQRLRSDDILVRFIRKFGKVHDAGGDVRPHTVLDFLGEQRAIASGMLTGQYEMRRMPHGLRAGTPTETTTGRLQTALGLMLLRCPPFLWTHEMRMLAVHYDVPNHTIGPASFPHEVMWWTWETSLALKSAPDLGHADGMLIARCSRLQRDYPGIIAFGFDDGWAVFTVGSDDGRGTSAFIHADFIVPDGTDSAVLGDSAVLLGMSAFLNSHFVDVTKRRPADDLKRWRGRRIGDPSSLYVVTLRSEVRDAVQAELGHGPQWKNRWLVRGHLRAQWYPSLKSHQVIWIAPYLKGPEDAPLKVPVYRVAR